MFYLLLIRSVVHHQAHRGLDGPPDETRIEGYDTEQDDADREHDGSEQQASYFPHLNFDPCQME